MKMLKALVLGSVITCFALAGTAYAAGGSNLRAQASAAERAISACGNNERTQVTACVSEALSNFADRIDRGDVQRFTPELISIARSASTGETKANALSVISKARQRCASFATGNGGEAKQFASVVAHVLAKAQDVIQRKAQ